MEVYILYACITLHTPLLPQILYHINVRLQLLRIVWNKLLRITFGSPCSWIEQNTSSKSNHFSHNLHGYRWDWWEKGELLMLVLKVWCDRVLCLNSFWTSCKYYILPLISESRRNIQMDGLSLTVGIPKSYQRQPTWLISPDKSRVVIKNKNCCYFQAKVVWAARSSWPSRSWHGTTSASSVPFARSPWWARASYRLGQRLAGSTNWDFNLNDRKRWNLTSEIKLWLPSRDFT